MINVFCVPHEKTSPLISQAMLQGFPNARLAKDKDTGDWAGFGSPETWESLMCARRAGRNFYYGDHAYFGRHEYYRITKNAFQHRGIGIPDFDKLKNHLPGGVRPWRKGDHVIVCVQSQSHFDRFGKSKWLEETLARLKRATDRRIIVREKRSPKPLSAELKNAWCVVTHSSNAAVEAILAGVPAICTADCAASIMSLRDPINIEYPLRPDGREEWAAVLAANQWNLEDIANGTAWKALNETVR